MMLGLACVLPCSATGRLSRCVCGFVTMDVRFAVSIR